VEFHPQRSFVNLSSRWRQAGQPHERSSRNDVPAGDMPSASGSIHGCRRREQRETDAHREPPPAPRTPVPGFLLDRGRASAFDAPGASSQTGPLGIDEHGEIVGNYVDAGGAYHGFRRDRRGRFTTIDVPGAMATQPETINNRAQVVGSYSNTAPQIQAPNGKPRGFLLDRGRFTGIDVPGAVQTQAKGINDRKQVVGEYLDAAGRFHGFLWDKGRFTTVDLPGATATSLTDINDRGEILGAFTEPASRARCTASC
jgi:probable HAF family extracellular repeat protein